MLQVNQAAPSDPNDQQQQTIPRAMGLLPNFTPLKKPNSTPPCVSPEEQLVEQLEEQATPNEMRLLRNFTPLKKPNSTPPCVSPEEQLVEQLEEQATPNDIKVDVIDQSEADTSLSQVDIDTSFEDSLEGPAVVDEENVFFMGDEVGELALGHFDGGDYYDAVWSFDEEADKSERRQKSDIRRSIAKSITPRSNYLLSPRGLDGELKVAIDWREQQQIHRRQSFKHKTATSDSDTETMENYSPKWWRHESPSGLGVITDSDTDEYELYPDTPTQGKGFSFWDDPDSLGPTSLSEASENKEAKSSADRNEVRTSLPEPDSSWYKSFFGADVRPTYQLDTFSMRRKEPTTLMSRLSCVTFQKTDKVLSTPISAQKKVPQLEQFLSEAELLSLSGYKDYGNGLAEC